MRRRLLVLGLLIVLPAHIFAAEVVNEKAGQEGNRWVLTYDLAGDEKEAEVSLTLTVQGKTYKAQELRVEGDVGKVKPGKGKRITWHILQDFPRGLRGEVAWELSAGGGPMYESSAIGAKFVLIPAGTFTMGSPSSEPQRDNYETQHQVTISRPFYLQTTEVTQGQWRKVMGNNPSYFKDCGDDCPVEQVSWNDVQEFIRKLNNLEGTDKYRLPTEAQWEYAARAGTTTPFHTGSCLSTDQANYDGNNPLSGCAKGQYRQKPVRVGSFAPNSWGLYDMHGNVWEWCQDWKGDYPAGSVTDPVGPSGGSYRVGRGGSWGSFARGARAAVRRNAAPDDRGNGVGFRLLRTY
jgi:formylglycine-generating enzyme required for sulfatase activity